MEGEAGALCVTEACLQGGELSRRCLVQPPLLAVRRCCLPLLLRGKPPSSAGVPGTEPTARTQNGPVDSMGASSGPLAHSGGQCLAAGSAPGNESSAGCRPGCFQHCSVDSSVASPRPTSAQTQAGSAPLGERARPQQRKLRQRNPSHATPPSNACERQGRAGGQGWVTEAPPHCLGRLQGLQEDLLARAGASCISPPLFALVPGMECVPGEQL